MDSEEKNPAKKWTSHSCGLVFFSGVCFVERACQHLALSSFEIEQACRHYFQSKGTLQSYEILSGGALNTTFKICFDEEWFVLRFYVRDPKLASIEKCLYEQIEGLVPVPKKLYTSRDDQSIPFALFNFCEKDHVYDALEVHQDPLSYDLGAALAKIHAIHFSEAGLFDRDLKIGTLFEKGSRPYFEHCFSILTPTHLAWKRLGEERAKALLKFIEENREYFPVMGNGGCLVHSDFKPVNLLWSEKDGLTVLDWEFAHSGHGLMDFGILLRHYQTFPFSLEKLEQGYLENGGVLPEDWIRKARITDTINLIQLLNTPLERPQLFQSLLESIDLTMSRWTFLDDFMRGRT